MTLQPLLRREDVVKGEGHGRGRLFRKARNLTTAVRRGNATLAKGWPLKNISRTILLPLREKER